MGLNEKIWSMAENLRDQMDASEFKYYMLSIIFYRYLLEKGTKLPNVLLKEGNTSLPEPEKLHNSLPHRLTYYQFSNGGMSNDNK